MESQLRRVYEQYGRQPDNLARNVYLGNLRDRNEVLSTGCSPSTSPRCCPSSGVATGQMGEESGFSKVAWATDRPDQRTDVEVPDSRASATWVARLRGAGLRVAAASRPAEEHRRPARGAAGRYR